MRIHLYPHVKCPLSHAEFQSDLNEIKSMSPTNQVRVINLHTNKYRVLLCENSELFLAYLTWDDAEKNRRTRGVIKNFLYEHNQANSSRDRIETATPDTARKSRIKKIKNPTKTLRKETKK